MKQLLFLDHAVFDFVFHTLPHPSIIILPMKFLSFIGNAALIWLALSAVLILYEEIKHRSFIIVFFLSLILVFTSSQIVIKNIIKRERPLAKYIGTYSSNSKNIANFLFPHGHLKIKPYNDLSSAYPVDYSFPSGHASSAFAASTVLSYFHSQRRIIFYLLAFLISFSRVYLGYHFVIDVFIGALIGYAVSKLIIYFSRNKWVQ